MSFFKLSKGWLRVNIVVSILIVFGLFSLPMIDGKGGQTSPIAVLFTLLIYWSLFFLIKWLKEGFNEK